MLHPLTCEPTADIINVTERDKLLFIELADPGC